MRFFVESRLKKCMVILTAASAVLLLSSCKSSNPVATSYVDSYKPPLTDQKGASYAGTYFPLVSNYSWVFSGTAAIALNATGNDAGQTIDEHQDTTVSASSDMTVLTKTTIPLSSGNYEVFPVEQISNQSNSMDGGMLPSLSSSLYQYFQVDGNQVLLRGVRTTESNLINEVKNPVYIKNPLVAGDSWECQPWVDVDAMVQSMGSDSTITVHSFSAQCKMFVVGPETITVIGRSRQTVRIDEAIDANVSITIHMEESGQAPGTNYADLNERITGTNTLNLALDTGIVMQRMKLSMNASAVGKDNGQPASVNVTENMDCNLWLSSFSAAPVTTAVVPKIKTINRPRAASFSQRCREAMASYARNIMGITVH